MHGPCRPHARRRMRHAPLALRHLEFVGQLSCVAHCSRRCRLDLVKLPHELLVLLRLGFESVGKLCHCPRAAAGHHSCFGGVLRCAGCRRHLSASSLALGCAGAHFACWFRRPANKCRGPALMPANALCQLNAPDPSAFQRPSPAHAGWQALLFAPGFCSSREALQDRAGSLLGEVYHPLRLARLLSGGMAYTLSFLLQAPHHGGDTHTFADSVALSQGTTRCRCQACRYCCHLCDPCQGSNCQRCCSMHCTVC